MIAITKTKLLKNRRTKIIVTLGPASNSPDIIRKLIMCGANVFRINMSHGGHAEHTEAYSLARDMADELSKPVAVIADLSGPKIRTGKFKKEFINIDDNSTVTITTRDVLGKAGLIPAQYPALAEDVKPGDCILLDDGALELEVESVDGTEISCLVIHGGILKNNKGINLPGVDLSLPCMTSKDIEDARFALQLGVDFLALSFVREADDIRELRAMIDEAGANTGIIAKIEKNEALENVEDIIDAADGIMIARGDLGVETSPEQVPVIQTQLIRLTKKKFKPVIVATQMIESMIENPRPTRAEATDISYAVTSGADAVMLSAESAVGNFPLASVSIMDRILRQTEAYLWQSGGYDKELNTAHISPVPISLSMANAVNNLARDLMARGIVVISPQGTSTAVISAARPEAPVISISNNINTYRKTALTWGTIPLLIEDTDTEDKKLTKKVCQQLGLASDGDRVLLVKGFRRDPEHNYPSVTIVTI